MIIATDFTGFTGSVFPSPTEEAVVSKQHALAEYGSDMRNALRALPPEISRGLLSEYGNPKPESVAQIEAAITAREFSNENIAKESTLDQQWLDGESSRRMDEIGLGSPDDWNESGM